MAKHMAKMRLCAGVLVLLTSATLASAADSFTATQGTAHAQKGKKAKAPKQAPSQSSGENMAQRDKRLARECKGRPNAGACEGYGY